MKPDPGTYAFIKRQYVRIDSHSEQRRFIWGRPQFFEVGTRPQMWWLVYEEDKNDRDPDQS